MAERKILQVRYLTYGWLFYKVHLLIFEQQNKREFYLELGVLTKNVTVMFLIVLAEAALR
jgi:hypothetical protein